jgi:hypothetical protein
MPSLAWQNWVGVRAAALDDLEAAHRALRGTRPGVRTATQQVNQAYALLLAAHFLAFCRDLHTECVDALVPSLAFPAGHALVRRLLLLDRKLDRGNPNPGNIGADFGRLGPHFGPMLSPTGHITQPGGGSCRTCANGGTRSPIKTSRRACSDGGVRR